MSEADYGQLALYNITATLPSTFYFGPLGQGVLRLFPVAQEKSQISAFHHDYNRLFKVGASIVLTGGIVGALICWMYGLHNWSYALLLIAGISIAGAYNTFRYGLQNSVRKRMLSMGLETGDRVLQQTLAILLLWFVFGDPLVVLTGYLLSSLIFLLVNRHFYQQSFPETARFEQHTETENYQKRILQYSWPFILFGVFTWFQNASDRWVLELLKSTELVGQYAVLNQIGFQSLGLLFGSISYFLFPILYSKAGSIQNKKQFDDANQINNWYLWFNIALTFSLFSVFYVFGEGVIRLLSDEKYVKLAGYLPWMVVAGGLFNFGQNYSYRFMIGMQTSFLLYPKVLTAIVGIILNFIFVGYYGLPGLVISICLTQVMYVAIMIISWEFKAKHQIVK